MRLAPCFFASSLSACPRPSLLVGRTQHLRLAFPVLKTCRETPTLLETCPTPPPQSLSCSILPLLKSLVILQSLIRLLEPTWLPLHLSPDVCVLPETCPRRPCSIRPCRGTACNQLLNRWLSEFERHNSEELLETCVRTLDALPVHEEAIRESGVGKTLNRLRRGKPSTLKTLADGLVMRWRLVARARKLFASPPTSDKRPMPPTARLSGGRTEQRVGKAGGTRTGSSMVGKEVKEKATKAIIPRKKRSAGDALGDALGAIDEESERAGTGISQDSVALRARAAAEAKKARIAQRRFGGAGGTVKVAEGGGERLGVPKRSVPSAASPGPSPALPSAALRVSASSLLHGAPKKVSHHSFSIPRLVLPSSLCVPKAAFLQPRHSRGNRGPPWHAPPCSFPPSSLRLPAARPSQA